MFKGKFKIDHIIAFIIVSLVASIAIYFITKDSAKSDSSFWGWLIAVLFIIFTIYVIVKIIRIKTAAAPTAKKSTGKAPSSSKEWLKKAWVVIKGLPWKKVWYVIRYPLIFVIAYFAITWWVIPWWYRTNFIHHSSNERGTQVPKAIYARLDTAGSNIMPQGVYRTFTISDKGPAANLFFTPQSSGIYQYHFKWMGDTTRQWTLLNEFDTNGVCIRDTLLSPMPYDEALIGEVAVCVTNRNDAVVVVERKEIVH